MLSLHAKRYNSKNNLKFINQCRFYNTPNQTISLLTNKYSTIEIDKMRRSKFEIDGQEIRKNNLQLLMSYNSAKIAPTCGILVGAKWFSGFKIPFITVMSKFWLLGVSAIIFTQILYGYKKSMGIFEPDNNFLTNFKYLQAANRIKTIRDGFLDFSIKNMTPEIFICCVNYYLTEDDVGIDYLVKHLTLIIQNNKKYFVHNFDCCVKFVCLKCETKTKFRETLVNPDSNSMCDIERKCKAILETLQKECDMTIKKNMIIKNYLKFKDYNHFYAFKICNNEKDTNLCIEQK